MQCVTTDATRHVSCSASADDDDQYPEFLAAMRLQFDAATAGGVKLFTTTAEGLFDAFLAALPANNRQHYNCRACRRFVDRFGGLVTITAEGSAAPLMWEPEAVPAFFLPAAMVAYQAVRRAQVNGVFLCSEPTWGLPSNTSPKPPGIWRHMHVTPSAALVHRPTALLSTSQAMAEKLQDYQMLQRGLAEFSIDVVRQAHALLTSGNLYRSEKCIGVARWLLDLHEARGATKNTTARDNLTWLAVATAPPGFCHVRTSMIGTLLEDIASGMAFEQIKRRFDEKMSPLQYQRSQAAPSTGNIAQAEKIVQALASAGALERRFAKLEDIQALWKPKVAKPEPAAGSVFGHLKPKAATPPQVEMPAVTMTWEKFARTVLPTAERIEFYLPAARASYGAMVTAANPNASPILQWDREDARNPVSWYFYSNGSEPQNWNLLPGSWRAVTAVALKPTMWGDQPLAHHGEGVFFLLNGARDMGYVSGAGFFPETLRSEYHGVRATMEAYAQKAVVAGADEATACGIGLSKGPATWNHVFRVTVNGMRMSYRLDLWD